MASAHVDSFVRDNLPPQSELPDFLFTLPALRFPPVLNASQLLDDAIAGGHGDRPAVLWCDGALTYRALLARVNRFANVLTQRFGLQPGNRVMLHAPNTPDALAAWWAVLKAGGVAVTTMPMLRAQELSVIVDKARVSHALVDARLAGACATLSVERIATLDELDTEAAHTVADFAPCPTAADDPALIAFTSGTTGRPKGCVHFHRDIVAMAETFLRRVLRPDADHVFCGTPPFAFTFGLGALVVFPVACGAAVALPSAPGFDPLLDAVEQHRATTLFTAPTGYRALLKAPSARIASLHTCVSAGEHLPKTTYEAWRDTTGVSLIDGIGATEMIHIFISAPVDAVRPGATGKAVPGYEARILDEALNPVPVGETGFLAVRGPTGCRYLSDPRQRDYVRGGWNLTGDLFRQDEDGYFWFVSRADDMIVSAGYNIAAAEVENALLQHECVAETAVVGVADIERGQRCKAFVVLRPPAQPCDELKVALQAFVKRTIAPYKYPREIEFVDALPKTHTGKLQRFKLRDTP